MPHNHPARVALICLAFAISALVLPVNGQSGWQELVFVQVVKDTDPGVNGLDGVNSLTVSPDGKHLYATASGADAVVVFARDDKNGYLTFVEAEVNGVGGLLGLYGATSAAVSPDGKHVYVSAFSDDSLAVFSRLATTGELDLVEVQKDGDGGVQGLDGARSVTVSPDGKHVYVAGLQDDAVAVFLRNATTGKLTFSEVQVEGDLGVNGLTGATSVRVSPDGEHLYVAGNYDDALALFSRNSASGALTFEETVYDGVAGVDGLDDIEAVIISPDGNHVYAAGYWDDAVAVFSRNSTTGALTFVEAVKDGVDGVDGLDGARALVQSPEGEYLFAAGYDEDAVAAFARSSSTGALTFVGAAYDGASGIDGLDGPRSVTMSPDGRHLYAAGYEDDAIVVFVIPFLGVFKADLPSPEQSSRPTSPQ